MPFVVHRFVKRRISVSCDDENINRLLRELPSQFALIRESLTNVLVVDTLTRTLKLDKYHTIGLIPQDKVEAFSTSIPIVLDTSQHLNSASQRLIRVCYGLWVFFDTLCA